MALDPTPSDPSAYPVPGLRSPQAGLPQVTSPERHDPSAELRRGEAQGPAPTLVQRLARHWPLWSVGALAAVMGVGVISAVSLLRLPNLPNCRAIFWPTASASTRIQCAEAYADQGTVQGYLDAIALLESLPADHPMRGDIDLRVEDWAERILDLAEESFQAGDLQQAIATARRIPSATAAAQAIGERVGQWNQIWQEAEGIYQAVEADLKQLAFQDAFTKATQLLTVGNTHWETVKYDELVGRITAAREDLTDLGRAKELARQSTLKAMEEAIAIAQGIPTDSPVYGEAQNVLRGFGQDLLNLAEAALDRRNAVAAGQFLDAIPPALNLGEPIADMRTLIDASQIAWQGGLSGLEGGIVRLQSIGAERPLYGKAQGLMRRWQEELAGRTQLEWARQVALPGTMADLQAAIAAAQEISRFNPAWKDAEGEIDRWRSQIQTTEDRPILTQAQQQAQVGDLAGAIANARQIAPGRALHSEAQRQIGQWRADLQRAEDGPLLAQARQLAAQGRLAEAIALAGRIGSGRVLYDEAQTQLVAWRGQVQGQQLLGQAYQTAQLGTASALVEAVRLAQQVPSSSPQRAEATQVAARWSWDILRLAEAEAVANPSRAIALAEAVPPQTEAYAQAQLRLREWRAAAVPQPQEMPGTP